MGDAQLSAFILVSFVSIATPGPDVLLATMNGSRYGFRRACYGVAGVALSDVVHLSAVALGGSAMLMSDTALFGMKCVGVVYLLFLGVVTLRSTLSFEVELAAAASGTSSRRSSLFVQCFLVAVLDPAAWLFFFALVPQFVAADAPAGPQYLVLSLVVICVDAVVLLGYALFGKSITGLLSRSGTAWTKRLYGGVLLTLAGTLILS